MINRICNKSSNKAALIEYLKVDQIEVHNAKEISNEFAKYFSTVGKVYANKIEESTTSIHTYISNIPDNPATIYLNPTNDSEITTLIHRLPNKTSKGHDCCDMGQNDTIGKIELNPSFVLSSDNTNCKNDIQLFHQLFDELRVNGDCH